MIHWIHVCICQGINKKKSKIKKKEVLKHDSGLHRNTCLSVYRNALATVTLFFYMPDIVLTSPPSFRNTLCLVSPGSHDYTLAKCSVIMSEMGGKKGQCCFWRCLLSINWPFTPYLLHVQPETGTPKPPSLCSLAPWLGHHLSSCRSSALWIYSSLQRVVPCSPPSPSSLICPSTLPWLLQCTTSFCNFSNGAITSFSLSSNFKHRPDRACCSLLLSL